MKFNSLILLSILSSFLLSCDSGLKFENPLEKNDSDSIEAETHEGDGNKTDTSAEQEDKDKTDSVSEYDDDKTDTASTNNGDSGDSKPDEDKTDSDNSDTAPEQPDNDDSAPEQPDDTDTAPDEDDFQPDDADSQSDDDADTSHGNEHETGDIREADCTGLPANAIWNTATSISQTWNGREWLPSADGTYNLSTSTSECYFKCKDNYNWNGSICKAATQTANCTGLPANAHWNTASAISQIWDGSKWIPPSTGSFNETGSSSNCYFKCDENYSWNSSTSKCVADTKPASCTGLPENASWNTVSAITQTWNGSTWTPTTTGSYNTIASTAECRYKCKNDYHMENSVCVSNTKPASCTGLPENAEWNTASSITLNWSSSNGWQPSTTGSFSQTASTNNCYFKCKTNYTWQTSSSTCKADSKVSNCTGLPANAQWNTASTVTQTWNGSTWTPTTTGTYNTTASTAECRYKCDNSHYWYNSQCTSPCDYEPCDEVANSTHECSAYSWNQYSCGCKSGYYWKGGTCQKQIPLGNICTGQQKCYNYSAEITCPTNPSGTGYDVYGQDAQYTGKCRTQSFTSSSNVVVDNNTGLTWEKSSPSLLYGWENRNTHCNELNSSNYGGKSNWRIPTPLELLTIVNNQAYNLATNSKFTNMPTSNSSYPYLWTSKENKDNTSYAYCFSPSYGFISNVTKTTYKVLCVSGNEMPKGVFTTQTISSQIVVNDSTTGLMWQKEYTTDKDWGEALKYCEDSTYAGYSDWRLPNKNELASLLNHDKSAAPYSDFPDMPSNVFWSSSTYVSSTSSAWVVDFGSGYVGPYAYKQTGSSWDSVRCVRSE